MVQLGFLCRLNGSLLKTGLPLIENMLKPLAKSVLVPSGLKAATSATDAAIKKKIFGLGMTTLVSWNENLNDIMKIIKSLEESGSLIKGVNETVENAVKEQKGGFLLMLAATLGVSLLGNILAGKRVIRAGEGHYF